MYAHFCSPVLHSGERLLALTAFTSKVPALLINCCSCILLSSVFLSPSFFSLPLVWTPSCCISWHSHPQSLSVAVVMEMLQTSRGISWQNSRGARGLGWRVTVGVGSQWEFSLYRAAVTPEPLGKGNKPVPLCAFECPVVGQRWPLNLPQCIEVTSSTGLQGCRTEQP